MIRSWYVLADIQTDIQTDTQTDKHAYTLITIFRHPYRRGLIRYYNETEMLSYSRVSSWAAEAGGE